ncbi:phosphopentomutase [Hutsoniella sourekii]
MATFNRIITLVLDSVGTGNAPDAEAFNDVGADTLGHVAEYFQGKLQIPTLQKLGISNLRREPLAGIPLADSPLASYGRMQEQSAGKDSLDGHWEMMGLPMTQGFDFFPEGFPQELINQLEDFSGRPVIGNRPESGTMIIEELGQEQMDTGALIVYTSGDSVLQIAAHEQVIPLEELYDICRYARSLVNGPKYLVGRVIARPYIGSGPGDFTRTANRHDFALEPTGPTVLTYLQEHDLTTYAVGKTWDIFSGQGFDDNFHNESDLNGIKHVLTVLDKDFTGFCFANLVDFDAKFGHRRDPEGFGMNLEAVDQGISKIMEQLKPNDLLMITADHGNDPCFKGTDHTREEVPLLAYSPSIQPGQDLGVRQMSDLGQTILDNFEIANNLPGNSFLKIMTKE